MPRAKKAVQTESVAVDTLAQALSHAIESARPKYKNEFNRKKNTPWTPKDGTEKSKLKRKFYQHGIWIPETRLTSDQIDLVNQLRPGVYADGFFRVHRRRDKGIDIDYPVKTSAQRLRMITQFGIRDLDGLLKFVVETAKNPVKVQVEDDEL